MIQIRLLILLAIFTNLSLLAQEPMNINPYLNEKGNAYMNRQGKMFLDEINKSLTQYSPQYPMPRERYTALLLLDAVLHDPFAAYRPPVQAFFHKRMESLLHQIENTKVEKGAIIWKLYNMGFIVRTATVTLAFDLVRGNSARSKDFELSDKIMNRFVHQCDALFISHRHSDHIDLGVAQEFIRQGKPVVAPPQVWKDKPIYNQIVHLKREAGIKQKLEIQNGVRKLNVVIFPGHQMSKIENNVSLVFTPEGLSFAHMGDQINENEFMVDYQWIDKVAEQHHVDVLMPPCWTNEIYRIVKGFDPELVIPGHENELGHPIDDRVPFWGDSEYLELTYPQLKNSDYPLLLMTWGESYHYLPKKRK